MSDLEKLEAMLPKLVHFLPNIRLRTASSLLFKLESGLLTHVLKFNASYVQMILDSITESLSLMMRENDQWKNSASAEAQTMSALCLCLVEISKYGAATAANSKTFSHVLEKLFTLQSYGILDGNARANLQAAITGVSAVGSPSPCPSSGSGSGPNGFDVAARTSTSEAMSVSASEKALTDQKSTYRGAGAILQSALASQGWQFPKVLLTPMDEKYLFDVEVKVKMGHESAAGLLWDALADFPAPTLVAHPGLLHAVLDAIGAANSDGAPASPKCLNAVGAINWLEKLVSLAVKAYDAQLDGKVCSLGIASAGGDDDDKSPARGTPSLATSMTQTLQNMRFPSVTMEEEGLGFVTVYGEPIVRSSAAMHKVTAPGVHPAPSLPGLAFAACAASMPLLQSTDAATLAAVASLLRAALPYVKEPSPFDDASNSNNVDNLRLQHLLNRMERIVSAHNGGPSLHNVVQMATYDASDENMTSAWLASGSRDATVMRALLTLLTLIPPKNVRQLLTPDAPGTVTMGPTTLITIRHMCTFANDLTKLVANATEVDMLWSVLEHVDPSACKSLQHCQSLLQQKDALDAIIMSDAANSSDVRALFKLQTSLTSVMGLLDVEGCHQDDGIVRASMYLLTRALEVRASGKGIRGAMSVVTRVLCGNALSARKLMIDNLLNELTPALAKALLAPSFLHTLIVNCILPVEGDALGVAASQLLERVLGAGAIDVRNLFMSAPKEWGSLLIPLKVLEWGLGSPHDPIATAVSSFACHLEESCARISADGSPRTAFEHAQLLGLFHNEAPVRAQCAARMKNELERFYATSSSYRSLPESRLQVDPFNNNTGSENENGSSFLYLSPWESLHKVQGPVPDKSSSDEGYSGAMKLANIAFGEQSLPIRVAAIRQLRSLLSDTSVLTVVETQWLINVASKCAAVLNNCYAYMSEDREAMDLSDARLCVEAATLLRLLVARSRKVRSAAVVLQDVDSTAAGRPDSARFSVLPAVVAVLQLSTDYAQRDSLLDGEVRVICAQILCLLSIGDVFVAPELEMQFRMRKPASKVANVVVPAVMAGTFQFPICTEDLSTRTVDYNEALARKAIFGDMHMSLSLGTFMCASKGSSADVLTNAEYLAELMAASALPPIADLNSLVASVVCKCIALAPSHEELRSVVSSAECLCTVMPTVASFYGAEKLDLALSRLLKTAPQTQKDVSTLSTVLQFLTMYVSSQQQKADVAVFEALTTAILFPLYPLMQVPSGHKPGTSQLKEYAAFANREVVQDKLFALLHALSAVPAAVFQLKPRLADHPLSTLLLDNMSLAGSSFQQGRACDTVHILMLSHGMYGAEEAPVNTSSFEALFHAGGASPVEKVVKTARLLRKPDSVQGYGPLVSSLKVLSSLSKAASAHSATKGGVQLDCDTNEMNWRWLVRLFYDRRAEVRLLSIEIYSQLHKIDRFFDTALETGDESFPLGKFLRGIAFDDSECATVRAAASRVLLDSQDLAEDSSLLGQILAAAHDQMSSANALLSSSTLSSSLSILISAMTKANCEQAKECVRALKIVPSVIGLLCGNVMADVEKISFRRVGVDIVSASITGQSEWLGRFDSEADQVSSQTRNQYNGWKGVWQRQFNGTGRMNMHIAMCLACRFLQVAQSTGTLGSAGFLTYSRQASLAQGAVASLTHEIFTTTAAAGCNTAMLSQAEGRGCSGLSDLACELLLSEGIESLGDVSRLQEVFINLSAVVHRQITYVCNNLSSANANLLASLLRLVCILLERTPTSTGVDCSMLMTEVLCLKSVLQLSAETHTVLTARVNVVLAVLMQRSPSLCVSTDTISESMILCSRGARLLADASQHAMEARTAATSSAARKAAAATAHIRLELWANMMLVQSALGSVCCDLEEVTRISEVTGFHKALGSLIDCADVWTQTEESNNTATPAFTSLYAFMNAGKQSSKNWLPSFAQLSVTCISLCCAFCRDNLAGKRLLLTSCDMRNKEGVGHVWGALDSLLMLGASNKVSSTVRLLALSLVSSVMSSTHADTQSFVQKSKTSIKYAKDAVMRALDTAMQRDKNKIRPECVALLLEALGSCFIAECSSRESGAASPSSRFGDGDFEHDLGRASPGGIASKIGRENRTITANTSMPLLLKWVWESYSDCPNVVVALVRFIGRLSAPAALTDGSSSSNARKLCLAAATSREALGIVADASAASNPAVSGMAALSLWSSLHASEQARANVKKLGAAESIYSLSQTSASKENNGASGRFGREQVQKARAALHVLLQ